MSLAKVTRTLCIAAVAIFVPAIVLGMNVQAGYELYKSGQPTVQSFFDVFAIPPGFFDPGSDPFEGQVAFTGHPLGSFQPCPGDIGPTDCIVRRNATAFLPGPGSTEVIPIEIVALSLVSVSPITITHNGGLNPELWDVRWGLSSFVPSTGTRTIRQDTPSGGTFDAVLYVRPVFTFTRQSDLLQRVLDLGPSGVVDELRSYSVPWSYNGGGLTCPDCVGNFFPSPYTQSGPFAAHTVVPGCNVATDSDAGTWGRIKALYR